MPSLPGCFTQGEDVEEALKNAREAIELYLGGLVEDDEPLPEEKELGFTVAIQAPMPERKWFNL